MPERGVRRHSLLLLRPMDFILYFVLPKLFEHVAAGRHHAQRIVNKALLLEKAKILGRDSMVGKPQCFRKFTLCLMLVDPWETWNNIHNFSHIVT